MTVSAKPLEFYGTPVESRFLLGTARYPSPDHLRRAVERSGAGIVTVSLRRESAGGDKAGHAFWELIRGLGVKVLPNTAGCHSAREAIKTALMAREVFGTPWIKLEVIGDDATLQPDPFGLVEAAAELTSQGFQVFPYMTDDLVLADRLLEAGCRVLMPWGAPIGSGRGLNNPYALKLLRAHVPDVPLVVDAGLGAPSHAAAAMELGYDAILLNTAVATAGDPPAMAEAFAKAIEAGRTAFEAGIMEAHDLAHASTPVFGAPFSPFAGQGN
ncbi:thiazole synthase [Methylobrevis albus]|uniref:Thiazole synthase n=1 Tax=Methylobrevis albus TaxID=2793297 RepID=A0A931MXB5_9HYPH|nr:thiazole synthase [Methylobrevis albus]MBH0236812.1 thiazole synthase [Methylobrevis albus]